MGEPFQCDNCGLIREHDELPEAKDILMRHSPGATFTDVECPECAALCFPAGGRVAELRDLVVNALDGVSEMFTTDANWKMSDVAGVKELAHTVGYEFPDGAEDVFEEGSDEGAGSRAKKTYEPD